MVEQEEEVDCIGCHMSASYVDKNTSLFYRDHNPYIVHSHGLETKIRFIL